MPSSALMHVLLCASYFLVLGLLAMYGLHRSHLVYTCLRYARRLREAKERVPPLALDARAEDATARHRAAPALQRGHRHGAPPRPRREDRRTRARSSKSRCSTTRPTRRAPSPAATSRSSARRTGLDMVYLHRVDRTGYKAGALDAGLKVAKGDSSRSSTPTSSRSPTSSRALVPHFIERSEGRHGAGALGPPEPRPLAPHARAGAHARRSPPRREPRALRGRLALQLLGHRRHVAQGGDRHERRLAARHAHRGSRPLLPRAARGLEVHLPRHRRHARRAPRGRERVPRAAVPLGQGHRADVAQAPEARADAPTSPSCSGSRRSST